MVTPMSGSWSSKAQGAVTGGLDQVERGGEVLARNGLVGAGAVQRQLLGGSRKQGQAQAAKTSSTSSGISPESNLAAYQVAMPGIGWAALPAHLGNVSDQAECASPGA